MKYINLNQINKPIFLKELNNDNDSKKRNKEFDKIRNELLLKNTNSDNDDDYLVVQRQIKEILKKSSLPAICLDDVTIERGSNLLNIDFLIITSTCAYILEVKNLLGDIYVSPSGEFYRCTTNANGVVKKGKISSPLTFGEKKADALKILLKIKKGLKLDSHYPILHMSVVGGNLDISNAPVEVQKKVYTFNQFVQVISDMTYNYEYSQLTHVEMLEFILETLKLDKNTKRANKCIIDTLHILKSEDDSNDIKNMLESLAQRYALNTNQKVEDVLPLYQINRLLMNRPRTILELNMFISNKEFINEHFEDLLNIFSSSPLRLKPVKPRNIYEKLESYKRYAADVIGLDSAEILTENEINIIANNNIDSADKICSLQSFRRPINRELFVDDIMYIISKYSSQSCCI